MSPAATQAQPLQYFIHYDFDALRMVIAGSLIGRAAQRAYEAWRTAILMARRLPLVVDISFVTEADEVGRAVLRCWQKKQVRLVVSPSAARVIADSSRRASVAGLTAGNPACAGRAEICPADAKGKSAQNAGFSWAAKWNSGCASDGESRKAGRGGKR
jgi:hypothetical protein